MTEYRDSSNISDAQGETRYFGNCKECHQPLKLPFYQYYHNDITGENYRTGPVSSFEEWARYGYLVNCKCMDGFPKYYLTAEECKRLPSNRSDKLCSLCDGLKKSKSEYTQLHFTPDSANEELDGYVSQLPDLSNYRDPRSFYGGFIDSHWYDFAEDLSIAFADEKAILAKDKHERLDDLRNNFIKDKSRRYPNEKELTRWLNRRDDFVSHCKIFDLRGIGYLFYEVVRRFVIIIHLKNHQKLWWQFYIPEWSVITELWPGPW